MESVIQNKLISIENKSCFDDHSDLSYGQMEVIIEAGGKRYDVTLHGVQRVRMLYSDPGDYYTPPHSEYESEVELREYVIYFNGDEMDIEDTEIDEDYLEELIKKHLG